jgi:thiamine-monophosphate kinase
MRKRRNKVKKGKPGSDQVGELEIIDFIKKKFPVRRKEIIRGIGDDGMVLRNGYVVSTDAFFEGIHFLRRYFSMETLGLHTLAASLSDLAAMGSRPVCALVSLFLNKSVNIIDIKNLYQGFSKLAREYKFDIAGGDVVSSFSFGISITVIGRARSPLLRSGGVPGQALYVTNFLGLAEVGRMVLDENLPKQDYPNAINKHLKPKPRINEALQIRKYATSCIDTSDGLSTDAFHLVEESKVKIVIQAEHIPVHSEVGEFCAIRKIDPLQFILCSGEDFELLFSAKNLPRLKGMQIFKIGYVGKGKGLYLSTKGIEKPLSPTGYEHRMQF